MFLRSFQKNSSSELCYAPVCNSSIFWKIEFRSVIRQKSQSQNEFFKKTKHAKFFKKGTFHTPWYAHVGYQGVRSVRFSENLACFVFLKHPFWTPHQNLIFYWYLTLRPIRNIPQLRRNRLGDVTNFPIRFCYQLSCKWMSFIENRKSWKIGSF